MTVRRAVNLRVVDRRLPGKGLLVINNVMLKRLRTSGVGVGVRVTWIECEIGKGQPWAA